MSGGVLLASLVVLPGTWGQSAQTPKDLTSTSLEDLLNVEVTTASKKEQKLSQVAAAIYVIKQQDIQESGATNIPDLLRMVPGMDVGQINGSTWAIGGRGFNQQFSNKLLVMIDGRIIYTPNFAGVYWDTADLPLAEIERIEVILGPGGTIWGANAVNGVINIITKNAADTHGGIVQAASGNLLQEEGTVEYGAKAGRTTDYRVYAKYFNEGQELGLDGNTEGGDGWHMLRGGFRSDSRLGGKDDLTVEGSLYQGREGELGSYLPSVTSSGFIGLSEEISLSGGFLEGNWRHQYSEKSDSNLQVSYTRYKRGDPLEPETRDTVDVDFKQHSAWGGRQDLVWGGGYHYTNDAIGGSFTVSFVPPSRGLSVYNAFVQDEFAVVPHKLQVTAGSKFEHNDYTGIEVMPSVRAAWTPSNRHMFWAAVSRALRIPSRNDTNLVVNLGGFPGPTGTPVLLRFTGNPGLQDERLVAYEAGYRTMISNRVFLDLAAYYNTYSHMESTEPAGTFFEPTPLPAHEVQLLTYENLMHGETHGFEIAVNWKVTGRWQLKPGFAFANEHLHLAGGSRDTQTVPFMEGNSPDYMAQLRSHVDISRRLSWDLAAYYVDALTDQGPLSNVTVPSNTRLDTGLTWSAGERATVSVFGQNLLRDHHLEFEDVFGSMQSGQMRRSAYAKIVWRF